MGNKKTFPTKITKHVGVLGAEVMLEYAQCPICKRWFDHFLYRPGEEFRGIKQHIRIWANRESLGFMLGEIKDTPHFNFWRDNTEVVPSIPKNREWKI